VLDGNGEQAPDLNGGGSASSPRNSNGSSGEPFAACPGRATSHWTGRQGMRENSVMTLLSGGDVLTVMENE
jgi:hypothetical protein